MREDVTAALRSLRQSPTFTAVALVVLALGIGPGTAIFSVVDAVVLRALPFDEHDRLVAILEHDTQRATTIWSVNKDQRLSGDTVTLEGYMDRRRGLVVPERVGKGVSLRGRADRRPGLRRRDRHSGGCGTSRQRDSGAPCRRR